MVGLERIRVLPTVLVGLILASTSQAQSSIDFGFYPKGAQDCLYDAAKESKCEAGNSPATNSCLCRNGGDFITLAAECIGRESRDDLKETYATMKQACDDSSTPINISESEFMEAANPVTSTSSTPTSTANPTEGTDAPATTTPAGDEEDEDDGDGNGISTGALAGIIAGGVVGLLLVGLLAFFLFRRRRNAEEESHPMLPQKGQVPEVPSAYSSYYGSPPPDTAGWPKKDWAGAVENRNSGFNWESPAHLSYAGARDEAGTHPPGTYQPVAELAPSPVIIQELDGTARQPTGTAAAPVEMPAGSPVATTTPPSAQFQPYRP